MSNIKNPELIFTEQEFIATKYGETSNITDECIADMFTPDEKCREVSFSSSDFGEDIWVTNLGQNRLVPVFISMPYTQWNKIENPDGTISTSETYVDPYYSYPGVHYGYLNRKPFGWYTENLDPDTGEPAGDRYGWSFHIKWNPITDKPYSEDCPNQDIPPNLYVYHDPWPYATTNE
jgi:hypothetical protein